ncbi:MAG: ATP-binding protein, partial [Magnetococcus sp. YQC-5]
MQLLRTVSLRSKLILLFLLLGLLPLIVSEWITSQKFSESMLKQSFSQMEAIQRSKKIQVEAHFTRRKLDLGMLAIDHDTVVAMQHFKQIFDDFNKGAKIIGGKVWEKSLDPKIIKWLDNYVKKYRYYDICFFDMEGNLIYSTAREVDLGQNVITGPLKTSSLHDLFMRAQHGDAIQDFEAYGPSNDQQTAFMGTPVRHEDQTIGVLVLQLSPQEINPIMSERNGMGQTGETYLAGKHKGVIAYRSNRIIEEGKIGQPVQTPYIEKALAGFKGTEITPGVTGELHLISYFPLEIPGLNWAVIGAISLDEVEAPIYENNQTILLLGCMMAVLVIGVAFVVSKVIVDALQKINGAARQIAGGTLSARVDVSGTDEIGQLARVFNQMAQTNEEQFWVKSRIADLTAIIQTTRTSEEFSDALIRTLAPLLEAGHGVIYVWDELRRCLRLQGTYGYKERKHLNNEFVVGVGLVGQCALEKKPILQTEAPENYIQINSGLGEAKPLNLLTLPLLFQDQVLAVIELASFHRFTPIQKALLEELSPILGLGLENHNRTRRTEELLEQTRLQAQEMTTLAEELQVQQEEVKQTNQVLAEKNKALLASDEELRAQQEEIKASNRELLSRTKELETQQEVLEHAQRVMEKTADELAQSNRYKSEFLANISHELRNPLNSLLILSRQLARNEEGNLTSAQVNSIQIVHNSGQDLLALINDILDLAKIESGKLEISQDEVDIQAFAAKIDQQFRHMAQEKGVAWKVEVAQDLCPKIVTDEGKLGQIIKNLISNAIKFTDRGMISVRFHPLDASCPLAISVTDTGIGIPEEKLEIIFEAFRQADGTTTRRYGGTGLGLSISRELAVLLGGQIRVKST